MFIYTEPDNTKYPPSLSTISNPGLEQLTGADMCLSPLPFPFPKPVTQDTLQEHIEARALFVQIKVGYDFDPDRLKNSIARMQQAKIPKGQAVLLPVGKFYGDENDKLRIVGVKQYGALSYSAFLTTLDMWGARGGIVEPVWPDSIDDLPQWIERKTKMLETVSNEPVRVQYPNSQKFTNANFEDNDIWQEVIELDATDPRAMLCNMLPGIGTKTVQSIVDTAQDLLGMQAIPSLLQLLKVAFDQNEKGKPLNKIPGIGAKGWQNARDNIGLFAGYNLDVREVGERNVNKLLRDIWRDGLEEFERRLKAGIEAKEIQTAGDILALLNKVKKSSEAMIEF